MLRNFCIKIPGKIKSELVFDTISKNIRSSTILDINSWTYAKYFQKVIFRERAKSAYFRSASSDKDSK